MVDEPIILSVETATLGGSVCLAQGTRGLASRIGDAKVSHSNSLLADINDCLKERRMELSNVDLFACALGPGSFTGLRIGIATVKALAATLERPCVGVSTLAAIAAASGPSPATIALLPAGRGEVFAQMFSVASDGEVVELDTAAHLSPTALIERYRSHKSLLWAGAGAYAQRHLLKAQAEQKGLRFLDQAVEVSQPGWHLAPLKENLALHVSELALKLYKTGKALDANMLRANYVRPSDAELNQTCQ